MNTTDVISDDNQDTLEALLADLHKFINPKKAAFLPTFFKTGIGQYGEGDQFLGIMVPNVRKIVKMYSGVSRSIVEKLLESPWHEERLCGVLLLVDEYEQATKSIKKLQKRTHLSNSYSIQEIRAIQKEIAEYYLYKSTRINNWDLVDLSARKIIGCEMLLCSPEKRTLLYQLSQSNLLWDQRIAIVSTYALIRENQFEDTIKLSKIFIHHPHDLMHKACGWMLREVGKRDKDTLVEFLEEHKEAMPRTMLRYAIEKFSKEERDYYMGRTKTISKR